MAKLEYPLKQVLEVKQKRVEDAEKVLREKIEALDKEKKKLQEREEARNKVRDHQNEKLRQLRKQMDEGDSVSKIEQMKAYLKIVQEKLKVEEKKVKEQQEQVAVAEKNVEIARKDLNVKRQEVEKLVTHKSDWEKQMRKEREVMEGREQDELGNIIHGTIKRRRKAQ